MGDRFWIHVLVMGVGGFEILLVRVLVCVLLVCVGMCF